MDSVFTFFAVILIVGIVWGIRLMNSPRTAVRGNRIAALCVLAGIVLTLVEKGLLTQGLLWGTMGVGALIGWVIAAKVAMIQMPQLVGTFNGLGGGASALVALLVLGQDTVPDFPSRLACVAALAVGGITFSGSLVAAGKLARWLPQLPVILPGHALWSSLVLAGLIGVGVLICVPVSALSMPAVLATVLALVFGVLLAIRVGGADMPITISLLNSLSGVAGSFAGFAVRDPLLVAAGGIVGAAGLILTVIMCRASNRSLVAIISGRSLLAAQRSAGQGVPAPSMPVASSSAPRQDDVEVSPLAAGNDSSVGGVAAPVGSKEAAAAQPSASPVKRAADLLRDAGQVVIVPGYGMALAEAQREVRNLYDRLEEMGKQVRFAIHPVAGRMPGHMHVLLSEVEIPYERLCELDDINDEFAAVDVAVVVGANDVVNPAANTAVNTPIYGMPVLKVEEAKRVVVCNQDTRPGYCGVPNPLYELPDVVLCLGDASETMRELVSELGH